MGHTFSWATWRTHFIENAISAFQYESNDSLDQTVVDSKRQETTKLLLRAVCQSNVKELKQVLKPEVDITVVNHNRETVLHVAAFFATDVEIIRMLLLHGANFEAADGLGNTPLIVGARRARPECVEELLKHGAQVNAINHLRETALSVAVFSGSQEIVKVLLAYGAYTNIIDSLGRTPLHIALTKVPLAKLLVKYTLLHNFVGDSSNHFNLNAYSQSKNFSTVACYFEKCVSELSKMTATKVNSRCSLYVFITTMNSNIPLYSENESTQIIAQKETLLAEYPIYSDFMLPKVKYALERGMLLRKLKEMSIYSKDHHGFMKSFEKNIVLNHDCAFIIAKYLSNGNLWNLMLAFDNFNPNFIPRAHGFGKGLN